MVKRLLFALLAACTPDARAPIEAPVGSVTAPATTVDRGAAVTFVRKPWTVGESVLDITKTSTAITMTGPGSEIRVGSEKDVAKKMTVRKVDGDSPSELYVHYDRWEESETLNDEPKPPKAVSLAGKTYVARAQPGSKVAQVRDPDGADVPAAEADEVSKSIRSELRADPFAVALGGRAVRVGEEVPAAADAIAEHFADSAEKKMDVSNAHVVLRRLEGNLAIFDVAMKVTWAEGTAPVTMDLTGEATISTLTTRTSRFEVHGPITMSVSGYVGVGSITVVSTQR